MKTETGVSHETNRRENLDSDRHRLHGQASGPRRAADAAPDPRVEDLLAVVVSPPPEALSLAGVRLVHGGRGGNAAVGDPRGTIDAAPRADEAWLMGAGILAATLAAQAKTIRDLNTYIIGLEHEVRVLRGQGAQ